MPNAKHVAPDAPIQGFRYESGTIGEGIAVIRGTAEDQAKLGGANPTAILGVIDHEFNTTPAVGDVIPVRRAFAGRRAYMQASAAIAVGAKLTVTAAGKAATAASGNTILATADAAAAADGDLIPVVFQDGNESVP